MKHYAQFVSQFMTEDLDIFAEGPLPQPPPPPTKRKPSQPNSILPPPAPPKKKTGPQYRTPPPPPGSPKDLEQKERNRRNEGQKARERKGLNRSPFGDSLMREINRMMQD
jgi:hypothetical protein